MKKLDQDIAGAITRARRLHVIIGTVPLAVLTYLLAVHIFPILQDQGADVLIYSLLAVLVLTTTVTVLGYGVTQREAGRVNSLVRTARQALFHVLATCKELTTASRDIQPAAALIATGVCRAIKARAAVVWVLEEGELRVAGTQGTREQGVRISLEPGRGMAGRAIDTGRAARNVTLTREDKLVDEALGIHTLHAMAVPMVDHDGGTVGVLTLHDRRDDAPFSSFDLEIATAIAQAGALAISKAHLAAQRHRACDAFPTMLGRVVERAFLWPGHCERVEQVALAIAEELRLDDPFRQTLRIACRLHDVGIDVPLTPEQAEERGTTAAHPDRGAELAESMAPWKAAAEFIRTHHERMDGRGYPNAMQGYDIPLGGRILALAEWWDEVTHPTSPLRRMSETEALEYLEKDGGAQFDPPVAHAFRNALIRQNVP